MMASASQQSPPWSDLPPDLLGRVISRLPFPADRARFRSVCRSWRSAVRQHVPPPRQLPWIALPDGSFFTLSDQGAHHLALPKHTSCIGATDGWLALDCTDVVEHRHTYFLHNPFSNTTTPLTELDSIIGKASEAFEIRKVLMRSTADDLVAILTNNWNYPLILCRPGKGTWLPEPQTMPYVCIIDVAFLGDKLYGITKAEDLFALDLADDGDSRPTVTSVERVIRHPPANDYDDDDVWRWSDSDDGEESSNEHGEEHLDGEASSVEGHDEAPSKENSSEVAGGGIGDDDHNNNELPEGHDESSFNGDGMLADGDEFADDEDVPYDPKDLIVTIRYLVTSRGKLLMVRRQLQVRPFCCDYTRQVEVLEADLGGGAWVPLAGGLGGGQALFISTRFSKSLSARGEVEEDLIYSTDTGDACDMRSRTFKRFNLPQSCLVYHRLPMWVFPPELAV